MQQALSFPGWSQLVARHREVFLEAAVLGLLLVVASFFVWQIDVFPNQSAGTHELVVELDEGLAVASLLFAVFSFMRLRKQKRETRRRVAAERAARALALEDPLTGLPNRRQFDDALKAALGAPPRAGASHAVLLLDLNGFKRINDLHGHPRGDDVLIEVGMRLRRAVRDGDLVARLGGDEFAVLALHVAGPDAASGIALRIIELMQAPVTAAGTEHPVGAAIGVALFPQDASDREHLLRKADVASYRAKAEGGSALRFFEPEMDRRLRERDGLERDLRAAIGTPDLRCFYQPVVELKSGEITGFEALARWTHPQLGEVEPARFISIADSSGLIVEVTDHLLRQACADALSWSRPVLLSFNVSPVQLKNRQFGTRVLQILAETGLPPNRLEIEITESALVRDLDSAQEILGAVREAGVRIALSDFGTGYSSLYHLRNFKLDKIKIDRGFVENMARNGDSAAIVRALVGLGSGLSLTVTAEGVEDPEQCQMLIDQGCNQAQGFLFSEAVSAEAAQQLVQTARSIRTA